jgi:formyltetrahydrofolate-dependent phosphoribosylglycinamide formyltransferase
MMADKLPVAVLISGRGSNMQALIEYEREAGPAYEVVLVASNVPEARGLVLARRFGIATWAMSHKGLERAEFDALLDAELRRHAVEAVALAGYMRLLSDAFIAGWVGRILNVHPSLLPLHKGLDTHRRALLAGDLYAGCSVHLVTAELDSGPVLAQARVRIGARDDAGSLAERVLAEEHRLYPRALDAFARERLAERERGDVEARNG